MAKLTKRIVDAADVREKDYFIWDDELPVAFRRDLTRDFR